jgi:hypothetical protein
MVGFGLPDGDIPMMDNTATSSNHLFPNVPLSTKGKEKVMPPPSPPRVSAWPTCSLRKSKDKPPTPPPLPPRVRQKAPVFDMSSIDAPDLAIDKLTQEEMPPKFRGIKVSGYRKCQSELISAQKAFEMHHDILQEIWDGKQVPQDLDC